MARPGKHKYKYDKYKNSGHQAENKRLRAERDKKRREKFARRREEGKTYKYEKNPYEPGTPEYNHEAFIRANKNESKKTEHQRLRSLFAKLDNEINKEIKQMKKEKRFEGKERQRPPRGNSLAADEVDDM